MWARAFQITMVLCLATLAVEKSIAAEMQTLFTTPAERQLINSNRYRSDDEPVVRKDETPEIEMPLLQQLITKEFTREYQVSGVTVSREGNYTVWINSQAYEDGGVMEDNSQVEVINGDQIRVRITTPDGKQHHAVSGETLEVTYVAAVDESEIDAEEVSVFANPLDRKFLQTEPYGEKSFGADPFGAN